jgi:hypothetical protein
MERNCRLPETYVISLWRLCSNEFYMLPLSSIGLISQFLNHLQTVGLSGRVISSSARPLPKHRTHKHRINAYTQQTSMPYVGFEPTVPASERAKTVHVLDRYATVTSRVWYTWSIYFLIFLVCVLLVFVQCIIFIYKLMYHSNRSYVLNFFSVNNSVVYV